MPAFRIVEALDVVEHVGLGLVACSVHLARCSLGLQRREEAFHHRVVPDVTRTGSSNRRRRDRPSTAGTVRWCIGCRDRNDAAARPACPVARSLSTLLAAIAEFERELIRERTGAGRERAMARGVAFGRKPKLTPHQRQEALARRSAGETLAEIARSYNVDQSMISPVALVGALGE